MQPPAVGPGAARAIPDGAGELEHAPANFGAAYRESSDDAASDCERSPTYHAQRHPLSNSAATVKNFVQRTAGSEQVSAIAALRIRARQRPHDQCGVYGEGVEQHHERQNASGAAYQGSRDLMSSSTAIHLG